MTLFNTSLSRQGRFMRSVAPARGLLRQSQNRLPQADPPIFCRRSAPLTPPQARRSFSASAYAAKEIVMSAAIALAILVPMSGGNGASARDAPPYGVHRFLIRRAFHQSTASHLARSLPQIIAAANRKALQSDLPKLRLPLVVEVFTTSFQAAGRHLHHFRLSTLNAPRRVLAPNTLVCPARVAEIDAGHARIVSELPELPISSRRGPAGFDASSNAQQKFMTLATLDPRTSTVTFSQVYDGERNPMPQSVILK